MKKIFFMMAAMACASISLSSCDERLDEPKAQEPTNPNFLNTPPTANFTYDLANTSTVTLTLSQPDYQVATTPTYQVQIALKPNFDGCPTAWQYNSADATPLNFYQLPSSTTSATIEVSSRELSDGINAIRGYNQLSQLEDPSFTSYEGPLYIRVVSSFPTVNPELADLYTITSNVITLKKVIAFKSLRMPGFIYLIGQPSGWNAPEPSKANILENWKLFEADDKIGSQIYSGTFDIAAGQFQFRFYSKLESWDLNSIGAQNEDNPVNIVMTDNVYNGPAVVGAGKGEGKGSWQIPGWEGGRVSMTVNVKAKTVEFKKIN